MTTPSAIDTPRQRHNAGPIGAISRKLLGKLWVSRPLYECLPYIYLLAGMAALTAALFMSGWGWLVPGLVIVGLGCLHAGLAIVTVRFRFRRRYNEARPAG